MRNFARINNYYNRIEAWKDWRAQATQAIEAGFPELAEANRPPEDAGWRKIDKCTDNLRAAIAKARGRTPRPEGG